MGAIGMADEIISAIVGSTIAKIVSRWAPSRRKGEFASMPLEALQRRNRWLYRGLLFIAGAGFIAPYLLFTPAKIRGAWFAGAVFGLPFSAMVAYVVAAWCVLGERRARELLFCFAARQKTSIYVFYVLAVPSLCLGLYRCCFCGVTGDCIATAILQSQVMQRLRWGGKRKCRRGRRTCGHSRHISSRT